MEYKLALLGRPAVGKSSLVMRYVQNCFIAEYDPYLYLGDTFRKHIRMDDRILVIDIFDEACNTERFSEDEIKLRVGFLLCFSITDRQSFQDLQKFASKVLDLKDSKDVPMVVVGCKGDLEDERQVSDGEVADWAHLYRAEYILTSSKNDVNLSQAFEAAVRVVDRWRAEHPSEGSEKRLNKLQGCGIQ